MLSTARALPRTRCHSHVRVRIRPTEDERHRQATEKHEYGNLRQRRTGSHE